MPPKVNLLYIEDEDQLQDLIPELLSHTSTEFNSVAKKRLNEGIDYIKENFNEVDIVLLDLNLPNSKGLHTFEALYKITGIDIPIVIVSGFQENACKCVRLGAQDYIVKTDLNSGLLYRSLKYAIERSKIKKEMIITKAKYKELIKATKSFIYEVDIKKNKFSFVNDNLIEKTGWSKKELLSNSIDKFLTKKSLVMYKDRIKKLKNGEHINHNIEYEALCKDGSTIWILNTSKFIEDRNHNIKYIAGVGIDITKKVDAINLLKQDETDAFLYIGDKIKEWEVELENKFQDRVETLQTINQQILSL